MVLRIVRQTRLRSELLAWVAVCMTVTLLKMGNTKKHKHVCRDRETFSLEHIKSRYTLNLQENLWMLKSWFRYQKNSSLLGSEDIPHFRQSQRMYPKIKSSKELYSPLFGVHVRFHVTFVVHPGCHKVGGGHEKIAKISWIRQPVGGLGGTLLTAGTQRESTHLIPPKQKLFI